MAVLSHQYLIAVTSLLSSEILCILSCRNWVELKARVNFKGKNSRKKIEKMRTRYNSEKCRVAAKKKRI